MTQPSTLENLDLVTQPPMYTQTLVTQPPASDTSGTTTYLHTDTSDVCTTTVVSVLDSPAVDPRSNLDSGWALLMSEKSQAVYYISS